MKRMGRQCRTDLTLDERNQFSLAFKNAIGVRRGAWSFISDLEKKRFASGQNFDIIRNYKNNVSRNIQGHCGTCMAAGLC